MKRWGMHEKRPLREEERIEETYWLGSAPREQGKNNEKIRTFLGASTQPNQIRIVTPNNAESTAAQPNERDEQPNSGTGRERKRTRDDTREPLPIAITVNLKSRGVE